MIETAQAVALVATKISLISSLGVAGLALTGVIVGFHIAKKMIKGSK